MRSEEAKMLARKLDKQPLVLIIEDNDDIAEILQESVWAAGFEAEVLKDGRLALLRILDLQPDLIVLDLHLPMVDGIEIFQDIRADERMAHIPVIIATADPYSLHLLNGQPKPDFILIKPFGFRQFCAVLKNFQTAASPSL
jgi:DNA-binding response OmpR family regulator